MTVSSGFFNSVNHDRLYDAEQLSSIFDGIIVDGVYENVGEAFNVTAYPDANNTVLVGTGRAWFNHTWTLNDSRFSITLDPPNEMLGRIDAIVIDVNKERDTRQNSIIYLKGDEATPDFPPTLINTENHHQYPIAYITRHAEQNGPIKQSDIEITVGTGACPIATGVLEAQNLENLMQQLDTEFNEWWEGIKDLLDENVATNLQNQIDEIKEKLEGDTALVGLLEKPIADAFMSGDYGLTVTSYAPVMATITDPVATSFELQNTIGFLPNGEVCSICICYDDAKFSNYSSPYYADINITDSNGTNTNQLLELQGVRHGVNYHSTGSGGAFYTITDAQVVLIESDIESYPATFKYLSIYHNTYNSNVIETKIITISISSSKTVAITYSDAVSDTVSDLSASHSSNWSLGLGKSAMTVRMSDSSIVQPSFASGSWEDGTLAYGIVAVVNPDGVITSRKVTSLGIDSEDSGYVANAVTFNHMIYHKLEDKLISYFSKPDHSSSSATDDSGARLIVDPETLDITFQWDAAATYPLPAKYDYITSYGVETYSLSEKNGVQASEIKANSSPVSVTTDISPYFLGASNLAESLPEGSFIAAKDPSGRLYGIAGTGQQLAIGTNGGAAMLKTKQQISTTIDISKVPLWQKGFYNNEEYTAYLMINGTTNYVMSYPFRFFKPPANNPAKVKTASVVKIMKGV